jgi:endonuclease-3 related protein
LHAGKLIIGTEKENNEIFEVVTGAVLTQNTSWKNVVKALQALTNHVNSFSEILETSLGELKILIRPAGFFNQKAAYLKSIAQLFIEKKGNPSRNELLACKGVGSETADAILLYALSQPSLVVDSYTRRILARVLGRTDILKTNYAKLQEELMNSLPKELLELRLFHTLLIVHGQAVCHKLKPLCDHCPALDLCAYA